MFLALPLFGQGCRPHGQGNKAVPHLWYTMKVLPGKDITNDINNVPQMWYTCLFSKKRDAFLIFCNKKYFK
jgi:hypothetical protein